MNTTSDNYWTFISYSRADQEFAKWLHKELERFHIPVEVRPRIRQGLRADRLAPVFRDVDELPASSDLGARLVDALDRSRYLIVVCSPSAAQSRWVDAEVAHFMSRGRGQDILVVVVRGEPGSTGADVQPFPPALLSLGHEPLWVDARPGAEARNRMLVRIAAGMLQTGFDNLWQRERRRRRRVTAIWSLASLATAGILGAVFWSQQKTLEHSRPQNQIAAFQEFMRRSVREGMPELKDDEIVIQVVRTDNINNDGLLDFFAFDKSRGSCGSGGCSLDVYVAKKGGKYDNVLNLFGHSSPTVSKHKTRGYKDIKAIFYMVDGKEPIYNVFVWNKKRYDLSHYEFCNGRWSEYCDPMKIIPIEKMNLQVTDIRANAPVFVAPADDAAKVGADTTETSLVGKVEGKDWYLVQLWKSVSGFVRARDVTVR